MPRDWEGNRRSGITLAMRHGLKWLIHELQTLHTAEIMKTSAEIDATTW